MKMSYKYTVRQAAAILHVADLVVTNDSLHLHLSGAMDKPCVAIFGNTNGKVMTQDYPFVKVVQGDCEPCWYDMKCGKDYQADTLPCVKSISVDRVFNEIEKLRC